MPQHVAQSDVQLFKALLFLLKILRLPLHRVFEHFPVQHVRRYVVQQQQKVAGACHAQIAQRSHGKPEHQAIAKGRNLDSLPHLVAGKECFCVCFFQAESIPDVFVFKILARVLPQGAVGGDYAAGGIHDQHAVGCGVEHVFKAAFFNGQQAKQLVLIKGVGALGRLHAGFHPHNFKSLTVNLHQPRGQGRCALRYLRGEARQGLKGILHRQREGLVAAQKHAAGDAPPQMAQTRAFQRVGPAVGIGAQRFERRRRVAVGMAFHRVQQSVAGGHAVLPPGCGKGQVARSFHAQRPLPEKNLGAVVKVVHRAKRAPPLFAAQVKKTGRRILLR